MTSPLGQYATATLVWSIPTPDYMLLSYDGHPLESYSKNMNLFSYAIDNDENGITNIIMTAFLKAETQNRYQENGVSDNTQVGQKVFGYCVTPPIVDRLIQGGQQAEATFWRVAPGIFTLPRNGFPSKIALELFKVQNENFIALDGFFVWEQNIPQPFGVELILGDKIKGRFISKGEWVSDL